MTEVSGSLKLVTGSPAAVSQVWLRAPKGRVQGSEYVTEAPDTIQVTGGAVSFDALPGAMVMTLVSHGSPMHTVKLLVPDKTTATLAECIEAAALATDGTRSALERLALEVQAELGQVPALVSDALAQDATVLDAVKQASVIREDTTVGTRVFAGDTMVHGNTGVRLINHLATGLDLTQRSHHGAWMVREGNTVTLWGTGYTTGEVHLTEVLPSGFRPITGHYITYVGTALGNGTLFYIGHHNQWTRLTFSSGLPPADTHLSIQARWVTVDPWPSSLPGDPT